jgi:hypothetical protein
MKIWELLEAVTSGATGAANVTSLNQSPHIAVGNQAALKRWSGEPGKMGKRIKHKRPKKQKPGTNALNSKSPIIS